MEDKVQVLERAFAILERIATGAPRPHTVGELSRSTGLKIPTVSKIVRTMTTLGYLENTGRKTGYVMGEKIWLLSGEYLDMDHLRKLVYPHLEEYAKEVGEHISFSVLRGYHRRIVARIRGSKADPQMRYSYPAEENVFDSLSGICLVAKTSEARQLKFYRRFGSPPLWGKIPRKEYLGKMRELAEREYCVSDAFRPGRTLISYPVGYGKEIIGCIGSFMPGTAYSKRIPELIGSIAKKIARKY